MVITAKLARRIRERGMSLPSKGNFLTERLAQIAARSAELNAELDALDREVKQLADNEPEDA